MGAASSCCGDGVRKIDRNHSDDWSSDDETGPRELPVEDFEALTREMQDLQQQPSSNVVIRSEDSAGNIQDFNVISPADDEKPSWRGHVVNVGEDGNYVVNSPKATTNQTSAVEITSPDPRRHQSVPQVIFSPASTAQYQHTIVDGVPVDNEPRRQSLSSPAVNGYLDRDEKERSGSLSVEVGQECTRSISNASEPQRSSRTEEHVSYPVDGQLCGYTGTGGSKGVSKHFWTQVQTGEQKWFVIGTHFLARPTDKTRCAEREAQAMTLCNKIEELLKESPDSMLLVMGDMNDYDGDVPDAYGWTPNSRVLSFLKTCGSSERRNIMRVMDKNNRYTNWYDRNGDNIDEGGDEHSAIDHMLVTSSLLDQKSGWQLEKAFTDHTSDPHFNDHWPIVADFMVVIEEDGFEPYIPVVAATVSSVVIAAIGFIFYRYRSKVFVRLRRSGSQEHLAPQAVASM